MPAEPDFTVGQRVCVHPGRSDQRHGIIVDDFTDLAGHPVEVGGVRIAEPGRRWAITLDDGQLVFADSDELEIVTGTE